MRQLYVLCPLLCAAACASTPQRSRQPPAAAVSVAIAPSAPALRVVQDASLERFLSAHDVHGVVALLDDEAEIVRCSRADLCERGFVPASTFKLPNSIIGLETGVIPHADFVLPWDGVERRVAAWNHDHSLRTALRDSAVWYYQELARRVGPERMQGWLDRLAYGNRRIGAQVDQFWLQGPLEISPREQLDFLRRLARKRLPISARTREILLEISNVGELDGRVLRGKTGWAFPDQPNEIGWFVGFTQSAQGETYRYVAVLLFNIYERDDARSQAPPSVDFFQVRRAVAEHALREG